MSALLSPSFVIIFGLGILSLEMALSADALLA
jgi:hypothetical protein